MQANGPIQTQCKGSSLYAFSRTNGWCANAASTPRASLTCPCRCRAGRTRRMFSVSSLEPQCSSFRCTLWVTEVEPRSGNCDLDPSVLR